MSRPATSGAPSARTLLASLVLHGLALVAVMLVPMGALRRSVDPAPVDVVVHRAPPRVELPAPRLPLGPPGPLAAAPRGPERAAPPARAVVPPEPSAPAGPLAQGVPDLPPLPEAPPEPKEVKPAGILAYRDQFANLAKDKVVPHLGVDARYRDADDVGQPSSPTRLTANGPGSSGGINIASLSRGVGGGGGAGGGGSMQGVPLGRASSPITGGGGGGGGGRPLAHGGAGSSTDESAHGGPGASRTDEEIQIVFDRYKASFYRLYNRELRNDPTLQGQMVLRLTIEPDGSVSMVMLQSTDMHAPDLATQVVDRVRTINFGAKEGVQALTIVYPIDFLPAA